MSSNMNVAFPPLSTAQLSELALDAAIEVEDFISGRSRQLLLAKQLMQSLIATINTHGDSDPESRIDLTYLPIYESAVESVSGARPKRISDFSDRVRDVLVNFASADNGDRNLLPKLREFCLSIHEQALSLRIDAIRSNRPQASYAGRPF